ELREQVRRVFERASTRFGQAETGQSPSEEIGIKAEIGRVRLPDDQRRRAGEQLAPDVCLQSHVRGYVALALSPVLDRITGRVLEAPLADARAAEGEVPTQDGRSPQSESQAEAHNGATHAGPRGRVREDRAPNLSVALAPEQRAFETVKQPASERPAQSERDLRGPSLLTRRIEAERQAVEEPRTVAVVGVSQFATVEQTELLAAFKFARHAEPETEPAYFRFRFEVFTPDPPGAF